MDTAVPETAAQDAARRPPAAERVLDHILEEVDAGRLQAGMRVNAAKLAQTLGLSAAPVREALNLLAGRGVVDLLPDRGAVMRTMSIEEVRQLWAVLTPIIIVGLSAASQVVAQGGDAAGLTAAYAAILDRPAACPAVDFLLRLNEYHFQANRLGGNPFVTRALDLLGLPYWDRFLVRLIDVPGNLDGYLRTYRRLHDAVMAGDTASVAAVMQHHMRWSVGLIDEAEAAAGKRRQRRSGRQHSG